MKMIGRILLGLVGDVMLIWFAFPLVTRGIHNIGNISGIFVSLCLIFWGVFPAALNHFFGGLWKYVFGKAVIVVIGTALAASIVFVTVTSLQMIKSSEELPNGNTTVVILGCRVYGERASLMLRERMDAAYIYLKDHPESSCVLSGGKGPGEDITEAECMYRYLTQKGIGADRLYKEDCSTSTRENLLYSKELIEKKGLEPEITIVTNEFHQYRARKIARKLKVKNYALSGDTALYLLPTFWVRELWGILYENLRTYL